jgi:hypothetical protein
MMTINYWPEQCVHATRGEIDQPLTGRFDLALHSSGHAALGLWAAKPFVGLVVLNGGSLALTGSVCAGVRTANVGPRQPRLQGVT